jgi:hypothetical protein
MDALRKLLDDLRRHGLDRGHSLGLFHLLIGRRIQTAEGTAISSGLTWRELATVLKKARWPKDAVRDLGLNPALLPPRNRQQFWYAAISQARIGSAEAQVEGKALTVLLAPLGYRVA